MSTIWSTTFVPKSVKRTQYRRFASLRSASCIVFVPLYAFRRTCAARMCGRSLPLCVPRTGRCLLAPWKCSVCGAPRSSVELSKSKWVVCCHLRCRDWIGVSCVLCTRGSAQLHHVHVLRLCPLACRYLRHIVWGQALARMFLACTRYRDTRARIIVIQAFARMVVCRTAYNVRLGAIVQAQRFSRYTVRFALHPSMGSDLSLRQPWVILHLVGLDFDLRHWSWS